jgi:hypothetical protein
MKLNGDSAKRMTFEGTLFLCMNTNREFFIFVELLLDCILFSLFKEGWVE